MRPAKLSVRSGANRASALVTSLLVLVVLSAIVVLFLQSMSLERSAARSVRGSLQSEMAARSGYDESLALMRSAIGTNRHFIVSETNHASGFCPVLLIGSRDATLETNQIPLVSGPLAEFLAEKETTNALARFLSHRTSPAPSETVDLNVGHNLIENTTDTNRYRAPWTTLTNSCGQAVGRYAFLVFDEQARFNPSIHAGFSENPRTDIGRTAAEVRLDTQTAPVIEDTGAAEVLRGLADKGLTPSSLAQVSGCDYERWKHLLSLHGATDEDVIPAGYLSDDSPPKFIAYPDAGLPKFPINDLATLPKYGATPTDRAKNIADIICRNLPEFAKRDPSLTKGSSPEDPTGRKYAERLAASMVDAIDADSEATAVSGGEPAGRELAAYVAGVAERNTWISESAGPPYRIVIRSEFFFQLWNPFTVPVQGTCEFEVSGRQTVKLRGGGIDGDLADFVSLPVQVSLRPNEFKVVQAGKTDQTFVNPVSRPSSSKTRYPTWAQTSSGSSSLNGHPFFRMKWNGVLLDAQRRPPAMASPAAAGLCRLDPGNQFGPVGAIRWAFNFAPCTSLDPDADPHTSPNTVADPRGTWLSQTDWSGSVMIEKAFWQGRQPDDASGCGQDFVTTWADRDYVRANPQRTGIALKSESDDPSALASRYSAKDAKNAPCHIPNAPLATSAELGHVFDPAQVNDSGNATSGGSPPGLARAAGGRSLRIGQPEFPYWDRAGVRSIHLLDLFSANPMGTGVWSDAPIMRGRLNANTASRDVLAAVFDGVELERDTGLGNRKVVAERLADALVAARPFSRTSDFHRAMASFSNGKHFSPRVLNASGTTAMAAMDRAREELFARTSNLLGTQSRAFRVFVIGQALGPRGKTTGQSVIEASVELEPSGTGGELRFKTQFLHRR